MIKTLVNSLILGACVTLSGVAHADEKGRFFSQCFTRGGMFSFGLDGTPAKHDPAVSDLEAGSCDFHPTPAIDHRHNKRTYFDSIAVASGPEHGVLERGDGTHWIYSPERGFSGQDRFVFRICGHSDWGPGNACVDTLHIINVK